MSAGERDHRVGPPEVQYLRVSGVLLADDSLRLRPSYLSWNPRDSENLEDSPVQVILYEKDREILRWGAALGSYSDLESGPAGEVVRPLRAKIPFPPATTRLVFRKGGTVLAEVQVPESAPELSEVTVKRRARTYRITWRARHPEDLPLFYHVRASADGGKRWWRLGSRLRKPELSVAADELVGGGRCVVEVVAYDGVNTVSERVPVADAGPATLEVRIVSPPAGKKPLNAPVELHAAARIGGRSGTAGELAEFVWRADGEQIATGASAFWEDAAPGLYELELDARAGKLTARDKLRIVIAPRE